MVLVRKILLLAASAAVLVGLAAPKAEARHRSARHVAVRHPAPHVSALVVNAYTGATLYADAPDRIRAPASLTKMMTMFLAFEALHDGRITPTTAIPISHGAARQPPSRLGIAAGKSLPAGDALRIIAVDSANDVTVALAEALAGSEKRFVQQMNAGAGQLGMRDTRFANATGLKNRGNRTTARDMATLSMALIRRYPGYYDYFSTRTVRWQSRLMLNHNHLLGKVPGVDGIKTGYTVDAGYNLAASAKRQGRRIVVIVLGARTAAARDARVANLLELGFLPGASAHGAPRPRQRK
ncbi:hypothetical protein GCM10009087_01180 [Sphingomonas oligophenolica]|uniref:D-alanyl-D-alanine carboxypeptidase family protein n=1 Tax=Sphingomonas oligophenolica TaxID=301154 RepID=A0ABU9Y140_9SPHN